MMGFVYLRELLILKLLVTQVNLVSGFIVKGRTKNLGNIFSYVGKYACTYFSNSKWIGTTSSILFLKNIDFIRQSGVTKTERMLIFRNLTQLK